MDFWTIIFLTLAVVIFLKLRSVLGQRTGRERPPYDPYSARDAVRGATNDNVVTLPGRAAETAQKANRGIRAGRALEGIAEAGSPVAAGLDAIARGDKTFDAKHFVAGARAAYEMIVLAYAEGDRRTLKNLLSREVYEGFEAAIRERGRARARRWRPASWRSTSPTSPVPSCAGVRAGHRAVRLAADLGYP